MVILPKTQRKASERSTCKISKSFRGRKRQKAKTGLREITKYF